MDRRHMLLLTLAGIAAASPALAQATSGAAPAATPEDSPMGEAERAHIRDTLQVGAMSLALSRIAVDKVTEPKLKEFANFEIAEQETIGEILKPMAGGAAQTDPMQAEMVKKLDQAGGKINVDYVAAEIDGHNKLLQIQNTYLAAGKSQPQINVAKLARGMIKEHLQLLADVQKSGIL